MTPKIIELKQAPVVLVELDKEREVDSWIKLGSPIIIDYPNKVIGKLSDLTEGQFAKCVSKPHFVQIFSKRMGPLYTDYTNQGRSMVSAKCSWDTLLESEKVYTENPYKHPDVIYSNKDDSNIFQKSSMKKWQEAQSRTIDPKRTVVLIRKEDQK